jgi:hypothetical protein
LTSLMPGGWGHSRWASRRIAFSYAIMPLEHVERWQAHMTQGNRAETLETQNRDQATRSLLVRQAAQAGGRIAASWASDQRGRQYPPDCARQQLPAVAGPEQELHLGVVQGAAHVKVGVGDVPAGEQGVGEG